jgi:hypothetical protein
MNTVVLVVCTLYAAAYCLYKQVLPHYLKVSIFFSSYGYEKYSNLSDFIE